MTETSIYRIKLKDQVVILMIGLAIAGVATVSVLFPDSFEPGTGIARTAERLAPLLILVGLVTAAQPIVRIRRGALKVDGAGIHSPFYWSLARGAVDWVNVQAIELVDPPYGKNRGVRIRVNQGQGVVIPLNFIEGGEHLEADLRRRLEHHQDSDRSGT